MNYKYKCGAETISVWVWNDDFHTEVSVVDNETKRTFDRTIREDENGKFFTWNKNKIYLNDWIRVTMKELRERCENGDWITSDEMCQVILSEGVENVRFLINDMEYKVEERWNRELKQNYKLILVPVLNNEKLYNEDLYTMDMAAMLRSGDIKIVNSK